MKDALMKRNGSIINMPYETTSLLICFHYTKNKQIENWKSY